VHLVTVERPGSEPSPGVILGSDILILAAAAEALPAARAIPRSMRAILEAGEPALDLVRRMADAARGQSAGERLRDQQALVPRAQARLLAPIPDPLLILSCGMNYRAHLAEMKTPVPDKPAAFTKNAAQIIGPEAPILLPPSHPDMVDWEGEFTVVMGRACHRVRAQEALDHVAGYTIVNDVSARDWVKPIFEAEGVMNAIHAWEVNLLGKQFPTFCPMGPALVTRDEIPDPTSLHLETRLNGQVMQSTSTSDLVFGVAELIAYYSQYYRFRPGDVITTGSPAGVGFGRNPKIFMRAGDRIEVEIERIGVLGNPIEAG
jgi:2-keto-4-pentenoate hydratase/2-oxohepta-3-ene-1,7-dioic acid hydratase in catechol pathway